MRKLRLLGFALASSLTLFSTVDGLAQAALPAGQSVWDHNGSAVRLSTEGVKRQFFYQNPRAGLQEVGVQPGTLLFDGRKNGNQYSGTAYIFSKSCGALPYVVTGPVSPDERTVTLSGKAPRINANCQVVGYRDDVLVFNYLSGSALVVAQGADREYDDYVRQWQGCLSTPQSDADLANSVALCNQALTFPRISPDDHAKLLQQRTALTVQQQQRLQKRTGDLDQQRSYQSYLDQFGPCVGSYNVNACERALQSPYATQDRENLLRSLKIGREQACRSGSLSACDVAAASPAASTVNQPASGVPTSIIIAGMIATLCAMALVVMFFRDRGAVPGGPPGRSRHQRIEFPIAAFSARIKSFIKGLAPFRHAHLAQTAHAKGGLSLEIASPSVHGADNEQYSSPGRASCETVHPIPPSAWTSPTGRMTMQLRLKRSQRSGGMLSGKVLFALDARADLSPDERALVKRYSLGKLVVYDSEARKKHGAAAYGQFDNAATTPGYGMSSTGRSLWSNARGLASAAMAALSLRVTVDSLMDGKHIECKDLDELLGAEAAIVDACKNLKAYLETAQTFDGREEVVEF